VCGRWCLSESLPLVPNHWTQGVRRVNKRGCLLADEVPGSADGRVRGQRVRLAFSQVEGGEWMQGVGVWQAGWEGGRAEGEASLCSNAC